MTARFDPSRLALVDQIGDVLLVRGNLPLVGQDLHFAWKELTAVLPYWVTESAEFIDVSLIDNAGEGWAFFPEIRAFGVDASKYKPAVWPPYLKFHGWDPRVPIGTGRLVSAAESVDREGRIVWWPIEGVPNGEDPKVYLGSPGWDLGGLVQALVDAAKSGRKLVVYFHCMNGADRTGALHGAYLMKTKGVSLAEAITRVSKATSAGSPNADYLRLMLAYHATLKGAS